MSRCSTLLPSTRVSYQVLEFRGSMRWDVVERIAPEFERAMEAANAG